MSFYIVSTNINLQIPNTKKNEKSAFELGLLFLQDRGLFQSPDRLYKAPTGYTRPRQTIQRPNRL